MAALSKDERVAKEVRRIKRVFKAIPADKKAVVDGAIWQAARLRVLLDDLWADICDNGDTEPFCQSEKADPYDRERPAARLFNARDKNYQTTIKMLLDQLPEGVVSDPAEELLAFCAKGRKK